MHSRSCKLSALYLSEFRSLNSVCQVASKLSRSLIDEQRCLLFRICLVVALTSRLISEKVSEGWNLRTLKELRTLSCNAFKELFIAFRERRLEVTDVDVLFKFFIAPLIIITKQVPLAPQSALRLFLSWTEYPRLHYLLHTKFSHSGGEENTVFEIICNTLLSNSIPDSAKENIIDGILNVLPPSEELTEYGDETTLVLTQISKILSYIYNSLPSATEKKKVNLKHLEVLNRLSEHVNDSEVSERFAMLLLRYLELGTVRSEDTIHSLFITVSRMIPSTSDASKYLPRLIILQSSLTARHCRDGLVIVENTIAQILEERKPNDSVLLRAIADLDAWDARRVDEPDLDCRQSAYKTINAILERDDFVTSDLLHLNLHNGYHVLTAINDLSLRAMTRTNFHNVVSYIGKFINNRNELTATLNQHILPLLVKGLHVDDEMIRHEFIALFATVVSTFSTHTQLQYFVPLRNVNDADLDFFENVAHLQIHRRQRAFSRLSQALESGEIWMTNDVMLRYLVPILQPYVMELSSKTSSLSDEALKLLSYIMRTAPWKKYFPMLDFYLKRLKKENVNHKAVVRVIVTIVDSFPFTINKLEDEKNELSMKNGRSTDKGENVLNEKNDANEEEEGLVEDYDDDQNTDKKGAQNTIYEKVMHHLLPRLLDCAVGKDLLSHRKVSSGKHYKEDEDIQRAPVSIATVKLLQKLPQEVMDEHLHGIILKICTLLMSHSISVREVAGKTMIEIAKNLGPKYLRFIVREMRATLREGYQVHVMIYNVHKLLTALSEKLKTGDLDLCVNDIIEVCNMDVFGDKAEEKSITGITKSVPEAKKVRSFETYALLGRYINSQCLAYIFNPLIQAAEANPDAATLQKIGRLLRHFSIGLSGNQGIEQEALLAFIYQTMKEYVNRVSGELKPKGEDAVEFRKGARAESCFLIEKEPKSLHIFSMILKIRCFDPENGDDIAKLDPFVPVVLQCLELKYERVVANALRCMLSLLRFPLPSLRSNIQKLVNRLFILLSDYALIGAAGSSGSALEITQLIYKIFTQLIKDAPDLVLSSKRLQLLLSYVESDVVDSQKQATAFPLIRAIIGRKMKDPKIVEIIRYLQETSVTSEVSHVREQCRQVIALFAGGHPQSKNPAKHVIFYLEQLDYEYEDGRKSALEMLGAFFNQFKEGVNDQYCMLAFVKLSMRFVNDESAECRAMVSLAVEQLLRSVSSSKFNDVYLATRDWLQSKKELHQCIAMQVFTVIAKIKADKFAVILRELLPTITEFICGDILYTYAENSITMVLTCLTKMLDKCCKSISQFASENLLDPLLKEIGSFLQCSESADIRLAASRLCGSLFKSSDHKYFQSKTGPSREQLLEWTITQLRRKELSDELAEQAAKNVIFLFGDSDTVDLLDWLCRKLSTVCKFEIVKLPNEALRRITVFKVSAALILRVEEDAVHTVAERFLPLLYREMQGKSTHNIEELQNIATEVAGCFKERLGEEEYTKQIAQCRAFAAAKFEMRKRKQKEEIVTDPVKATLKKRKRNKAKGIARSRKFRKRKL